MVFFRSFVIYNCAVIMPLKSNEVLDMIIKPDDSSNTVGALMVVKCSSNKPIEMEISLSLFWKIYGQAMFGLSK